MNTNNIKKKALKWSLKVTKGHLIISKSSFSTIYLFYRLIFLKLFKNVKIMKTQTFDKMKYDLKGHPRSYKTTFTPKSF